MRGDEALEALIAVGQPVERRRTPAWVVALVLVLDLCGFAGLVGLVAGIPFAALAILLGWLFTRPERQNTRAWKVTRFGMWLGLAALLLGIVYTLVTGIGFAIGSASN